MQPARDLVDSQPASRAEGQCVLKDAIHRNLSGIGDYGVAFAGNRRQVMHAAVDFQRRSGSDKNPA